MATLREMQSFAQESQEHGMVGIHAHMQALEALEEAVGYLRAPDNLAHNGGGAMPPYGAFLERLGVE
jgi:hypothetical protein